MSLDTGIYDKFTNLCEMFTNLCKTAKSLVKVLLVFFMQKCQKHSINSLVKRICSTTVLSVSDHFSYAVHSW